MTRQSLATATTGGIQSMSDRIKQQLAKMLAHSLFKERSSQARLFEHLVTTVLDGGVNTELSIQEKLYPSKRYLEKQSPVRRNMSPLRKTVQEYYAREGENDPVIIDLPDPKENTAGRKRISFKAGESYTPRFRYNPQSEIAQRFDLVRHFLNGSPSHIEQARQRLDDLYQIASDHPELMVSYAEVIGMQLLLGTYPEELRWAYFVAGHACLDKFDLSGTDEWRIHNVRGLLHTAGGQLDDAQKDFDAALKLDRQSTVSRGWYTLFLLATGKPDEATRLTRLNVEEHIADPATHAIHGIFLCKATRFEEAQHAFHAALTLDCNCWVAVYGVMLLDVMTNKQVEAMALSPRLEVLLQPEDFQLCMRNLGLAANVPTIVSVTGPSDADGDEA